MDRTISQFDQFHVVLTDVANEQDRDYVRDQLRSFNTTASEAHRAIRETGQKPLDLYVRDEAGHILGGLTGDTYWDWLEVKRLWLDASMRGRGVGGQLLTAAEDEARLRGCSKSQLRTFSFQARGFYVKFGYRVVGTMEDYPPGGAYFWLRKDLVG